MATIGTFKKAGNEYTGGLCQPNCTGPLGAG